MADTALTRGVGMARFLKGGRLDPRESAGFSAVTLGSVLLVWVFGCWASFQGLIAVAGWMRLSGPVEIAVPIVVDGAILAFTLLAVKLRSIGKPTKKTWNKVGLFTAVSVVANGSHVWFDTPVISGAVFPFTVVAGVFVAALMPVAQLLTAHGLVDMLVEDPTQSPEAIQAEIIRKSDEERTAAAADKQRRETEKRAQLDLESAERAKTDQHEAAAAEWEALKNHEDRSAAGSPTRTRIAEIVLARLAENNGNMMKTADALGVEYTFVRHIKNTNQPELEAVAL